MKKAILSIVGVALLSALVLSSCQKDHDTVSLKATINTYRPTGKDAKTYIDNNRYVNWSNPDTVMINGTERYVTIQGADDNRVATIAGVTVPSGDYFAYYPANRVLTNNASGWPQVLLPQVQNYRTDASGNHQIVEAPMAAWCSGSQSTPALNFTNLCALLKIEMPRNFASSGNQMAYIRVSSSNTPLWGKATISGTTNPTLSSPTIDELYANDKSVTLDFTTNGIYGADGNSGTTTSGVATGVNSNGPFYVVLPPATDVRDLTIDVYVFTGTSDNRRTVRLYHMDQSTNSTSTQQINILYNTIYGVGSLPQDQSVEPGDLPYPSLGTGIFSVSSTKKVRFATGNLQYRASTGTWRFALNQWDAFGGDTTYGNKTLEADRASQVKWIDLFGYGTSGVNYQPWQSYINQANYARNNNINNSENDWGVNEISNGGNQPNKWRTLTDAEWEYLFNSRDNHQALHRQNVILWNDVKGNVILPDDFPTRLAGSYNWTRLSEDEWNEVSRRGGIFLPRTGYRKGAYIYDFPSSSTAGHGNYWTSTWHSNAYEDRDKNPWFIQFQDGERHLSNLPNYDGLAVRLVRDVN